MSDRSLKLVHLYPVEMNIYGDTGNVLALRRRLEWRGIGVEVAAVAAGQKLPTDADIIVSGGGQDRGASKVEEDLLLRKKQLHAMHEDGVVMLLVCGTYQLFGHRFVTQKDTEIEGIGILDIETYAGNDRLIGNINTDTDFGPMVGYENHSGLTYLGSGVQALGRVQKGAGNNDTDATEGAVSRNVFGTYLHGPVIPKNPRFADELIIRALDRKYGEKHLKPLDDSIEIAAQETASLRPR